MESHEVRGLRLWIRRKLCDHRAPVGKAPDKAKALQFPYRLSDRGAANALGDKIALYEAAPCFIPARDDTHEDRIKRGLIYSHLSRCVLRFHVVFGIPFIYISFDSVCQ